MTSSEKLIIIKTIIEMIMYLLACALIYFLWNSIIPDLFGLSKITFLQSVGLYILTGILFRSKNFSKKDS